MNEVVGAILAFLSVIAVLAGLMSLVMSLIRFADRELRGRKFTFILIGIGLLLWIIAAVSYWLSMLFKTAPAAA